MSCEITLSSCAFTAKPSDEAELIKYFEMASAAGFDGFELASVPLECAGILRNAAKKTGVRVVAVHGILDDGSCSPDAAVRKNSAEKAAAYLAEFAEFAPCPIVEHYHNRFNDPVYGGYFRDTVEKLLARTDDMNFIFCMENAPFKPEYDERYPWMKEIADFAASFGKEKMFMTFDLNHANLHEDPVALAAEFAAIIRHIHVSDNHGIREEHMIPGTGVIDLDSILKALYANGYTGPCNLELVFPGNTIAGADDFRKIYEYMRSLSFNGK